MVSGSCWGGGREAGLLRVLASSSGLPRWAAKSVDNADGTYPKKVSREHGKLGGVSGRGCRAPRSPLCFANSRRRKEAARGGETRMFGPGPSCMHSVVGRNHVVTCLWPCRLCTPRGSNAELCLFFIFCSQPNSRSC